MTKHPIGAAVLLVLSCALLSAGVFTASSAQADYPKPSLYPISWELKFTHSKPRRILVEPPTGGAPRAYWYVTYTVTNNTNREQTFLPYFEMVTRAGTTIRSDNNIPEKVFETIKAREGNPRFLLQSYKIAGELRIGEDQARDGVAIWPEPDPRMGSFSIFVGGLSGEIAPLKDDAGQAVKDKDGQPVILRKTLQLNYLIRGDEVYPGEDEVNEQAEAWVMR